MTNQDSWDVLIVGGGILGTSISYWLSQQYQGNIGVVEKEADVAVHTSRRNTGVIHRPFYLDPVKRRIFARCSQVAYGLWKEYAKQKSLPWAPVTTLEVAVRPEDAKRVEKYYHWGVQNGMGENELEVFNSEQVRKLEPHVRSHGGILSKTDTAVDYRAFTRSLRKEAERNGVKFITGFEVDKISSSDDSLELSGSKNFRLKTRYLINCAGGNSIRIAHMMHLAKEYVDLNFRGEYWEVGKEWAGLAQRNIYTVAQHPELPFLDPHWIVRYDGKREIGPNAVPVAGPYTYKGFFKTISQALKKIFEQPVANKIALLYNKDFLTLAGEEWLSSISKGEMAKRAQEFLPELKVDYLVRPGIAGVRAQVVDRQGNFIKEAIELEGKNSFHITNYNSPGATGSPAYAAWVVSRLAEKGHLDHLKQNHNKQLGAWNFDKVIESVAA